jgi:hypothetical protein
MSRQTTPQETALIAAHVQRVAELRQKMDLMLLRSMQRQMAEEQA